jgi:hypothetical protein
MQLGSNPRHKDHWAVAGELAEDRSREVHGQQAEVPLQPEVQPEVHVQVSPQLHKVLFISAKVVQFVRALFNVFMPIEIPKCPYNITMKKELAHTTVRLNLIFFSKITGAYLFWSFGGFLLVPTTQIYCLTSAIISETHIIILIINNTTRSSTILYILRQKGTCDYFRWCQSIAAYIMAKTADGLHLADTDLRQYDGGHCA